MSTTNKPHAIFWVIAVIALLWNLSGLGFFAMDTFMMSDEVLATLSKEQQEYRANAPSWMAVTYGIATIGGFLASVLFILKRKLSVILFGISLIAILVNMCYGWFALDMGGLGTTDGYVMPMIVVVLGIIFYFFSKGSAQKDWLK